MTTPGGFGSTPKEFLTKAEERFGKWIVRPLLVLLGGIAAWHGAPIIGELFTRLTDMIGRGLVLGALIVLTIILVKIVLDPKVHALFWYAYHGVIRKITLAFIQIDPIGKLRAYVDEYLSEKLALVRQKHDIVRGKRNSIADKIDKNREEYTKAKKLADVLQKRSYTKSGEWENEQDERQFQLEAQKILMLDASHAKFQKMLQRLDLLLTVLEKLERALDIYVQKTEFMISNLITEFEAARDTAEATEAVAGVLYDKDERTKIFNMTLDYVTESIGTNVAEIEGFLNRATEFLREPELESDMAEDQLLTELSGWSQKANTLITSAEATEGSVQGIVTRAKGAEGVGAATTSIPSPSGQSKYDALLKRLGKK